MFLFAEKGNAESFRNLLKFPIAFTKKEILTINEVLFEPIIKPYSFSVFRNLLLLLSLSSFYTCHKTSIIEEIVLPSHCRLGPAIC